MTDGKPRVKSRTIWFHVVMACIEALHAGFHALQPFLPDLAFVLLVLLLAMLHSAGGVYLRLITKEPLR